MPSKILSAALHGIDALPVEVEVDVLSGLPSFTVVGLTDKAIQESRERMTAALSNLGYKPPRKKTIVSLAPASLKKEGSLYDIPITIGYLAASGQVEIDPKRLRNMWCIGELGLDGTIRPVRGVLPIALAAMRRGVTELIIPAANAPEASPLADEIAIYAVSSLQEMIEHLTSTGERAVQKLSVDDTDDTALPPEVDMDEIAGQEHAKRALVICAAGGHNALLVGPPGTGKTLLAKALAGVLPPLAREEAYAVTSLYSIAGQLPEDVGLIRSRPFRSPHHGASGVALIGGGANPKPGEVSLAHHGVLFLDELPEFSRHVLEQLRQPIEDGVVTVSRAAQTVRYPARSMIVGAMNPCRCGYAGHQSRECTCSPADVLRYQRRVSGPLLDRFDLHVLVNSVSTEELLAEKKTGPSSSEYAERVKNAREAQWSRQNKTNAELKAGEIKDICVLDDVSRSLLYKAQDRFHLSSRSIHRLMKVSLTIADLEGEDHIKPQHLSEALQYREQLKSVLPDFV